MFANAPRSLVLIATLQFLPIVVLPPDVLAGVSAPVAGAFVALFAFLGVSLLRRRSWSRLAVLFVQGLNIIVRLLTLLSHAVEGNAVNVPFMAAAVVSMGLSAVVLYYIDQPEIQMAMQ